jgi:carboxypeptidase PM20D1
MSGKYNEARADRYAESLSKMIACPTINDPGADPALSAAAFEKLDAVMRQRFPLVYQQLTPIPIEKALLLRWKGADSKLDAVILMSHSDVVPADESAWKYPPFSGAIAENRIWGRGAADTKGSLCAIFEAVQLLLEEGFTPPRDVYLLSSHNEETMGEGAINARDYFVENNIPLALVSDEGGAVLESPLSGLEGLYAMLGVTEKGYANVRFTARSNGGHASAPKKGSPLVKLAAFIGEIERRPPFAAAIPPVVRDMFTALAPKMKFPLSLLLGHPTLFGPLLKRVMPGVSAQANAMLRTTCAFTMAQGSGAANVIPSEASIVANLRFIMHQPMEQSLAAIRAVAEKYGLEMTVEYAHNCSPDADRSSPMYRHIVACVEKTFPEAPATPYLMVGGTDSRHFAKICPTTVRFAPTILDPQQLGSIHGIDENLGVVALARAVEFYRNLLVDMK